MKTVQRAKRIGGSIMVRIPKEIVDLQNVREGDSLEIEILKLRKDWYGTFRKIRHR